jgi:hypothetical protein
MRSCAALAEAGLHHNREATLRFAYGSESPFWYFLAHRTQADSGDEVGELLDALNHRADEMGLPIAFRAPHAVAWANICRLLNDSQSRANDLDRMAFAVMKIGFAHVFGPKAFVDTAFHRILHNIQEPAFPGRSRDESVVDTFLANGFKLIDEEAVDASLDERILNACLQDAKMHEFGQRACTPARNVWDETASEYARRRPGWLGRQLRDPNGWLFD